MDRVEETAFAKINLDLRVCGRRADGFHELDSLVVFADVGDRLTIEPARELALTIEGPFGEVLANDQDNLVLSAATALAGLVGRKANVQITLDKRLPIASGLGGGSADAAATLRGLTRLWGLPLSHSDLAPLARTLGADVAVCLGSTASRMQGIGDRLTSFALPTRLPMALVNPGKAVSTAVVFRALDVFSGARVPTPFGETERDFRADLAASVNDLEAPAMRIAPVIGTVLDALHSQQGCKLARMSGSGATCFALFDDDGGGERDHAVQALAAAHPDWWVVATEAL
ncbi:MAG: 4-(cytidine 5'-diphospho)-2-C-methyl-D-erythritol kinase [Alphaproteobacteria bacterium]|nr:4-(cytidine 5'-diphospho)-2-C-methyl-D-erythritol kinase [Alphaproteobacteria bacterium]